MNTERRILNDAIMTCIEQAKEIRSLKALIGLQTVVIFVLFVSLVR